MSRAARARLAPSATRPASRTCREPVGQLGQSVTRPASRTCRVRAAAWGPWATRPAFRTCRVPAAVRVPPAPRPAPRRRPPAAEGVAEVERLERSPTPAAVRLLAPRVCLERSLRWSASRSCGPRRFCGDSFDSDRCEAETAGRKPGGFLLLGRSRQISPLQLSGYIYRRLTELERRV